MKKIVRIILVVLVLISIIGFGIFVFNYNSGKQLKTLTDEVNKVLEKDFSQDDIESDIKCKGKFAEIESTIKTYLIDSQKIYKDMLSEYNELNPDNIFSGNDLNVKKLKEIQENLSSYSQKAKELSEEYKEQNTVEKKEEYGNLITGIESNYYKKIYNSVINSEEVNSELLLLNDKLDIEYQNITVRIYNVNKVIDFLIDNQKFWEVTNGRIQFNNVNKLAEYYQILNKDVQE